MVRPDGTVIYVHAKAEIMLDERDEPARVVGTLQDITARRRVEQELRVKDFAIQSSINAIAMTDLDGEMTYVNDSWLRTWGFDRAEAVLGQPLVGFFEQADQAGELLMALYADHDWVGEMKARNASGGVFDVLVSASLVQDLEGHPLSTMFSFLDITERSGTRNCSATRRYTTP